MSLLETIFKKPDKTLYHYTSQNGLLGIINSKRIRVTHFAFLNDSSEVTHAIKLMKININRRLKGSNRFETEMFNSLLGMLDGLVDEEAIYVCSFSEIGDLLSQWRGYCPHGGYNIGFDNKIFNTITKEYPFEIQIGKCVYDIETQNGILNEILDNTVRNYKVYLHTAQNTTKAVNADFYFNDFMRPLVEIAPLIKNESFREEQEWRLIARLDFMDASEFKFREGNECIVPFYEFELTTDDEKLFFNEIILSPTLRSDLAQVSLKNLLRSKEISCANIIPSKIPYKG